MQNRLWTIRLLVSSSLLVFLLITVNNVQSVYGQTEEGKKIFLENCNECHGGGLFGWLSGAPDIADKTAWSPFLKKGLEEMTASALKGPGIMSPKGGCNKCSEDQIRATVEYIISRTKQ